MARVSLEINNNFNQNYESKLYSEFSLHDERRTGREKHDVNEVQSKAVQLALCTK